MKFGNFCEVARQVKKEKDVDNDEECETNFFVDISDC
jgi:hypothetical protein